MQEKKWNIRNSKKRRTIHEKQYYYWLANLFGQQQNGFYKKAENKEEQQCRVQTIKNTEVQFVNNKNENHIEILYHDTKQIWLYFGFYSTPNEKQFYIIEISKRGTKAVKRSKNNLWLRTRKDCDNLRLSEALTCLIHIQLHINHQANKPYLLKPGML